MGCAQSVPPAAVVNPIAAEEKQTPATPVSEALTAPSKTLGYGAGATIEAVQSFKSEDTGVQPKIAKTGDDVDLTEVDRLLEMAESEIMRSPVAPIEEAPQTPPLQKRQYGSPQQNNKISISSPASGTLALGTGESKRASGSLPSIGDVKPYQQTSGVSSMQAGGGSNRISDMVAAAEGDLALDEEDPWASLQSKYKPGMQGGGNGRTSVLSATQAARNSRGDDDDDDEVVVLDAGRNGSSSSMGVVGSNSGGAGGSGYVTPSAVKLRARPGGLPPLASGGPPRAGGWGNGDLAAAGTLMLGDEEPSQPARPPGLAPSPTAAGAAQAGGDSVSGLQSRDGKPAPHMGDDLGMEDIDDVDALIDEELKGGGLNADLANKLARFEAMNDDED